MCCVACGKGSLRSHPNNTKANDFFCPACDANFELKSGSRPFGGTVPDGAFAAMIDRLERLGGGPHLALLHYCPGSLTVRDLLVVPASLLSKAMILQRPPLRSQARRAGWVGCNIRIADVPAAGRIAVVRDGMVMPKATVVESLKRAAQVDGSLTERTWLVDALRCVERLGPEFTLSEVQGFETELRVRHPDNRNIRPKLRRQLQRLRDAGLLTFLGAGRYRRVEGG